MSTLRALVGAMVLGVGTVTHAAILYGPTYYTSPVASSQFSSQYAITNVFDGDLNSQWAIRGFAGGNPQGRDEAWFSFTLDQSYTIDAIRFAPRNASGAVNGINTINVWIGSASFGVDVTSASSTSSFLTTGGSSTWTQSNFASASAQTYALGAPIVGRYVLVQLINTTDADINRNLGAAEFVVSVASVPGGAAGVLGAGLAGLVTRRRRSA